MTRLNRSLCRALCCVLALLATAACAESIDATLVTLEGDERAVKLTGMTPDAFVLETGPAAFKGVAELRFGGADTAPPGATIVLRNGDRLNAEILSGDDTKLKIRSAALGEIDVGNDFLDGIVFTIKGGPPRAAVEAFMKAAPPKEDLLLLARGDVVNGFLEKFSDKDLTFNAGGQSRQFAFDAIAAFRLAPLKDFQRPAGFRATLRFHDGSLLTGKLLGMKDGGIAFEEAGGQQWRALAAAVGSIRFQGGKLVYLSDLKPKDAEQKPYVGGMPIVYNWHRDQCAAGGGISLGGKSYLRGIGVHSFTRLSYDLAGQYAKILCDVGVDDAGAAAHGACAWKIVVDGRELASGVCKAGDAPQAVNKEIGGAQTLELICDYGPGDDDAGDHMDWAGARLIKR